MQIKLRPHDFWIFAGIYGFDNGFKINIFAFPVTEPTQQFSGFPEGSIRAQNRK